MVDGEQAKKSVTINSKDSADLNEEIYTIDRSKI
jgi:hypothetical protein